MDLSDKDIEAMGFELFLDSEDLIKGAGFFGISDLKGERKEFDFGFRGRFREASRGAIDTDLDLSAQGQTVRFLQFIEDSSADIFDQAFEFDGGTLFAEVGAPLVVGVGREEGAIGGEDGKGEEAEEVNDLNEDLGDFDIERLS